MKAPPEVLVFGWYVVVGLSGGVWMFRVKAGWVIQMGAGQLNNAPCIFQITSLKNQRLDPPQKLVVWKMCLLFRVWVIFRSGSILIFRFHIVEVGSLSHYL